MLNYLLAHWYLVLAAVVSGLLLAWPTLSRRGGAGAVSAQEAVQLINREKAVLVDVSDPAEYAAGHAGGARNVPLDTLASGKNLPTNKALPLIVVCATGARAARAAGTLRQQGFANARALAGGLKAWREANLPVETSA